MGAIGACVRLGAGKAALMHAGQSTVVAGFSPEIDRHELTRRRAEEIYIRNGRIPGRDVENWTQAEEEIRAELERASRERRSSSESAG